MKVTALVPDDLIKDVQHFAMGGNLTESLLIALNEWVASRKLRSLGVEIRKQPLEFAPRFSAARVRGASRRRSL